MDKAREMLSTALKMEEKGIAFYKKAASATQNKLGKDIFRTLMKEEDVHMLRIKKIYENIQGVNTWTDEWKSVHVDRKELKKLFRDMAKKYGEEISATADDIDAIDVGIELELKSVSFYEEQLGAAADQNEKEFLKQMILEEKSHHAILSDMKLYLTDPSSWFTEHEHHGLDGA
jgi:rubrerythrin